MAEPSTKMKKPSSWSSIIPDWSLLPEELLRIISENLENCFNVIHARSVCSSWRSAYPFPDCLLRPSYSFPSLNQLLFKSEGFCTFEKIPLFLFRVRAPAAESAAEYFLGGISRDESEDNRMELLSPIQCSVKVKRPSPIQCSVKVELPESEPNLMNMVDCQILPLGHQYRMLGWVPEDWRTYYRRVALLPLNKEEREGEFVVLSAYSYDLHVLTSAEMKWMRLEKVTDATCEELVTFRGRFYAVFRNRDVVVIDPYSLEVTPVRGFDPLIPQHCLYLVPSGNDELFLVERITPPNVLDFSRLAYKVSRLDEDAGKWVEVSDLGDRLLFVGQFGNVCCSAKNLPDGCGLSGNSIVFIDDPHNVTYAYKYGVHTGREEDDLNCWRWSKENRVTILHRSQIVSLRVDCFYFIQR